MRLHETSFCMDVWLHACCCFALQAASVERDTFKKGPSLGSYFAGGHFCARARVANV